MKNSARTQWTAWLLALTVLASQAVASETIEKNKPKSSDGFYGTKEEGWFFYKDPPPPPKPVPRKKPEPEPAPKGPKPLSAEWIRENLDKYRFAAIDNPTKENVELYLLLQKLAMDKAEQFALAHRTYAQQNPGIDETIQNPTSTISRSGMTAAQEEHQNRLLEKIAQRAGIYYFFRSDCPYCHQQNPMLEILTRMTGLQVLPISLDRRPSDDGMLPNWRPDQGQGAYLGVEKTPTMYLVEPGGKVMLLSVGIRSVPDIRNRVIELARNESWITGEEYELAMRGLPRRFLTEGLTAEELENDPEKLLAALRHASTFGGRSEGSFEDMEGGASAWSPQNAGSGR